MSKRAPSTTQLLVITAFALSCFGILLFLWVTFGGPTPFKAKSYQVKVPFTEASQLAEQSDVRISGVNVGKVESIELAPNGKQALRPLTSTTSTRRCRDSTRAILRTKTLLGETYIELTPGARERARSSRTAAPCPRRRSPNRSSSTRSSGPSTRRPARAFQTWMQEAAVAIKARARTSPTRSATSNRPSSEFEGSSASSTARSWRPHSCSATAPRPSKRCAAAKASWRPDPDLERTVQDDREAQPGHRSAVPRLPHLPRRVAADGRPPQGLRRQRRPADPSSWSRWRKNSRRPWSPSASWRRKRRGSSKRCRR